MKLKYLVLACAFLATSSLSNAQTSATDYPNKSVRLIAPFPPGGAADGVARQVATRLSQLWGQSVIVDNRPGAGGMIGAEAAARSVGDPYILFLGSVGVMTVNQHIYKEVRYDAVKDFTPLSTLVKMPSFLVVNSTVPANNVKEFIAYAMANPGKLKYGSAGNGTSEHTNAVMLGKMAGIDIVHVPYKGIAPALTDLLGGHINFLVEQGVAILPVIKSNKVKALAVVTTLNESGVPGFDASAWYALYAPAGIPEAIQKKISQNLGTVMNTPEVKAYFNEISAEVATSTPAELAAFQDYEIKRWAEIVKSANIKTD